jgi:hypothetical protein
MRHGLGVAMLRATVALSDTSTYDLIAMARARPHTLSIRGDGVSARLLRADSIVIACGTSR